MQLHNFSCIKQSSFFCLNYYFTTSTFKDMEEQTWSVNSL